MYTQTQTIDKPSQVETEAARDEFARRVEEWLRDPAETEPRTWDEDVSSPYGGGMTEQAWLESLEGADL